MKYILILILITLSNLSISQDVDRKEFYQITAVNDSGYIVSIAQPTNLRRAKPLKIRVATTQDTLNYDQTLELTQSLIKTDSTITDIEQEQIRIKAILSNVNEAIKLENIVSRRAKKELARLEAGKITPQDPVTNFDPVILIQAVCPNKTCSDDKIVKVNVFSDGRDPNCSCVNSQ